MECSNKRKTQAKEVSQEGRHEGQSKEGVLDFCPWPNSESERSYAAVLGQERNRQNYPKQCLI